MKKIHLLPQTLSGHRAMRIETPPTRKARAPLIGCSEGKSRKSNGAFGRFGTSTDDSTSY
jgi:hypothetical protein